MPASYQDLQNKNVLVTGGANGLGYAIARAFLANGANVIIVGRDGEKLLLAKKQLGDKARCFAFDLNETGRLPELLEKIGNAVGAIDVLVNNAGINLKKEAVSVTDEEYQRIIQTNQVGVFALTREVAKPMIARCAGNIIMISSMAAHYGLPKVIAYTAAKAAVEGMTRALAVEWAAHGIRVNCIAPGFITTAMSAKSLNDDPERRNRVLARTPLGKLGEPADVAGAALFLASTQAKFVTGVMLLVDGGNSIGF